MEYEFLKSLEVIFIASAAVILLLHKLKMPSLIVIIAGIIIGPHGVGLIMDIHFTDTGGNWRHTSSFHNRY
jgi:Kef-type K+ transport system membrane component KefB